MPNSTGTPTGLNVSFQIPGEPISKARARFTKYGSKTVSYTPEKTKTGERKVALAFRQAQAGHKPVERKFYGIEATFYCGTRQRRDVDNMLKLILDGLNNVAYPDDNAVIEVTGRKRYVPKAEARTEVRVYELGDDEVNMDPCLHCGELYRTYESWQDRKFCSFDCVSAYRIEKRKRICEHCGKEFLIQGDSRTTKCCSRECGYARRRAEVTCAVCSTPFSVQKCHVKANNYCSDECRRKRDAESKRGKRSYPGTCRVCGGGTSRKEYTRCQPCKNAVSAIPGKPKKLVLTIQETE